MKDEKRQTGRTTDQIANAPHGAIYVWPVATTIQYPRRIAREIGRDDLEIIPESLFRVSRIMGRKLTGVVIDHATKLSIDGYNALLCAEHRIEVAK